MIVTCRTAFFSLTFISSRDHRRCPRPVHVGVVLLPAEFDRDLATWYGDPGSVRKRDLLFVLGQGFQRFLPKMQCFLSECSPKLHIVSENRGGIGVNSCSSDYNDFLLLDCVGCCSICQKDRAKEINRLTANRIGDNNECSFSVLLLQIYVPSHFYCDFRRRQSL